MSPLSAYLAAVALDLWEEFLCPSSLIATSEAGTEEYTFLDHHYFHPPLLVTVDLKIQELG